jgi:hypothetical protein
MPNHTGKYEIKYHKGGKFMDANLQTIDVSAIDWEEVAATTPASGAATSGIVGVMRKALDKILESGKPMHVTDLQHILYNGFNKDREDDQDEIVVNWSTVKQALVGGPYKEVTKNMYTNGGSVKPRNRRGRK